MSMSSVPFHSREIYVRTSSYSNQHTSPGVSASGCGLFPASAAVRAVPVTPAADPVSSPSTHTYAPTFAPAALHTPGFANIIPPHVSLSKSRLSALAYALALAPVDFHTPRFGNIMPPHVSHLTPPFSLPFQAVPQSCPPAFVPQLAPPIQAVSSQHPSIHAYPPLYTTARYAPNHSARQDAIHHAFYTSQMPHGICVGTHSQNALNFSHSLHWSVVNPIDLSAPIAPLQPTSSPLPLSSAVQPLKLLTLDNFAAVTPEQLDDMLGERLYPNVTALNSTLAPNITGMLLELDDMDLLYLIDTPDALIEQVREAERVFHEYAESIEIDSGNSKS